MNGSAISYSHLSSGEVKDLNGYHQSEDLTKDHLVMDHFPEEVRDLIRQHSCLIDRQKEVTFHRGSEYMDSGRPGEES